MDTRTNELFGFLNEKTLNEAMEKNPFLVEVDCGELCIFREENSGRAFCTANRIEQRLKKCQIKRKIK